GGSYAFGYHWTNSQAPTPVDALYAFQTASVPAALTMVTQPTIDSSGPDPSANYFLTEFSYGTEDAAPDLSTSVWTMYLGDYSGAQVNWRDPNSPSQDFGISGIHLDNSIYTLQNGMFYGFRVNPFDLDTFLIVGPSPSVPVAVPEPATLTLAAFGLMGL